MHIYLFLAEGFEEIEAVAPLDIFRRAGLDVTTVSVSGSKIVKGAHAISIEADALFEELNFGTDSLLFLPGGLPGTYNLEKHEALKVLLQKQSEKKGLLAAICAAPSVLGKMGFLKGKEAICYPGFENQLEKATISNNKIVRSDNVFTAKAAGVAIQFALKIVEDLKGKETAEKIASAIYLN
jgi:protein deglycase